MWNKRAEAVLNQINDLDIGRHDLDNIAYYMTHLSSPKMWKRILDFGEAMVYHSRNAMATTTVHDEGEQLCLPFSK